MTKGNFFFLKRKGITAPSRNKVLGITEENKYILFSKDLP